MQVGKRVGGFLYLHRTAVDLLPSAHRAILDQAVSLAGDSDWNVAKIGTSRVSLLLYEDFDQHAFPALLSAATVRLEHGTVARDDYGSRDNPPILHRKELLLRPDDPRIPSFRAVTRLAEEKNLFAHTKMIGTRKAWADLVETAGLVIKGPKLLRRDEQVVQVSREKTAITRPGLSTPVNLMLKLGVLKPGLTLFDYGCGLGRDLEILEENGFEAFGWDPAYRPGGPRRRADVVNLGFVVNVIENRHEREETLKAAWSFAEKAMAVSAMLLVKVDVSGQRPHGDGFLTSRSTFQKYYTQEELLGWVGEALGEQPISLGQGIVCVFRDKNLEQEVLYSRQSRAVSLTEKYSIPRRERPAATPRSDLVQALAPALQAIWDQTLELGRLPGQNEVGQAEIDELTRHRVSLRRALQLCEGIYDFAAVERIAKARIDDLLVFGALSIFPGAPRYSSLSPRIQRDIRHFFGSHSAFMNRSAEALGRLRDQAEVIRAFEFSAASSGATYENGVLSFAMRNEASLDLSVRIMLGCAEILSPGFSQCDAVDIGPSLSKLTGYVCQDFDTPLPRLAVILKVDLARQFARNLSIDDGVLYSRSRFLCSDDEGFTKQRSIDRSLVAAGIVDDRHRGPTGRALSKLFVRPK